MNTSNKIETHTAEELRKAIQHLFYWQKSGADNFTAKLYELMAKADPTNRQKLFLAFPAEAKAYSMWYCAPSAEEFFKLHGF